MHKLHHALPHLLLCGMLTLCACESKHPDKSTRNGISSETSTLATDSAETAEAPIDSLSNEEVSTKCGVIYCELTNLSEQLAAVNSPDALIRAKKDYLENLPKLTQETTTLDSNEQAMVQQLMEKVTHQYEKTCREYEMPANGVIDNLNHLISRIDKVHSKAELQRFQDVRIGMLRKLDDLYLCVEHDSKRIPEVKRLAMTLKSKYESKKNELGL